MVPWWLKKVRILIASLIREIISPTLMPIKKGLREGKEVAEVRKDQLQIEIEGGFGQEEILSGS